MQIPNARLFVMAVVVSLAAALAAAQTKPNVNGTWKMNPAKTKFGPNGGPEKITIKFDLQGATLAEVLTLTTPEGERSIDAKYTTDGKENAVNVGDNELKATAKWEGDALVIEWRGGDNSFRRKFTVSEDGKTMTIAVHHSGGNGDVDETVVMEKQ